MESNKITKKKSNKKSNSIISESDWNTSDDNKLIALYKRNVPEFALSKILKKSLSQIRERIILLMKKQLGWGDQGIYSVSNSSARNYTTKNSTLKTLHFLKFKTQAGVEKVQSF